MMLVYRIKDEDGKFSEWMVKEQWDLLLEKLKKKNPSSIVNPFNGSCLYIKLPEELATTGEVEELFKEMLTGKAPFQTIVASNKKEAAIHFKSTEDATKAIKIIKDVKREGEVNICRL